MTIQFTKMQSLGNDFVVVDTISQMISARDISIPQWAHRRTGIGFDQLLLIKSSDKADFACEIFNADGSEAEQCGNGMRCVAHFLREEKLIDRSELSLETKAGIIHIQAHDYANIRVNMGVPKIGDMLQIQLDDTTDALAAKNLNEPSAAQKIFAIKNPLKLRSISIGNPHAILLVPSIQSVDVTALGSVISTHTAFPHGVNVGFMEIIDQDHIHLRTYERGAGYTLACGSNSCAAVVAGIHAELLNDRVTVELPLGVLTVEWKGGETGVILTGDAKTVFKGKTKL